MAMMTDVFDDRLGARLLSEWQQDFPLCPAPFAELAGKLGVAEGAVLRMLERLRREGQIARVGAVFAPKRIGASSLAAMAVPPEKLAIVTEAVNRFPEVNQNYVRRHRYNLWFVASSTDEAALARLLARMGAATGCPPIALPLVEEFHIDLGFCLQGGERKPAPAQARPVLPQTPLGEEERRLIAVLPDATVAQADRLARELHPGVRRDDPLGAAAEVQLAGERREGFWIARGTGQRQVDLGKRHVGGRRDDLGGRAEIGLRGRERTLHARGGGVAMLQDPFQRLESAQQVGGSLLADALDARQAVGRIAAQRREAVDTRIAWPDLEVEREATRSKTTHGRQDRQMR